MPLLSALHQRPRAAAHARGAYNGAHGMTFSIALILAPLFGGYVYDHSNANTLWAISGAPGVLSAYMFWRAQRQER